MRALKVDRGRPETLAPPVHQQLAARRGVAEANEAAAQLHLACIRADRGEDLQVEEAVSTALITSLIFDLQVSPPIGSDAGDVELRHVLRPHFNILCCNV